jgi:hypothetical protein
MKKLAIFVPLQSFDEILTINGETMTVRERCPACHASEYAALNIENITICGNCKISEGTPHIFYMAMDKRLENALI